METFCMVVLGGEYVTTYCWRSGGAYSLIFFQRSLNLSDMAEIQTRSKNTAPCKHALGSSAVSKLGFIDQAA